MTVETPEATVLHSVDDEEARIAAQMSGDDEDGQSDDEVTLEQLAEEEQPTPPTQLSIPGATENLSLNAGGAKPTSSEARFIGARRPITGQYMKGDVVKFVVTAKVTGVYLLDTTDEWGSVQKTVRAHMLRAIEIESFGKDAAAAD